MRPVKAVARKRSTKSPRRSHVDRQRWAVWQLADDKQTYGNRAGWHIIVTEDGREEVLRLGVMRSREKAQRIVDAHNVRLYVGLDRTGIRSLDRALFVASCFAGNSPDRRVTIAMKVRADNREQYCVVDGRGEQLRGEGWTICYVVEAPAE